MHERPILFQGAMVRAILAGTKTQTRRAVKPQPSEHHWQNIPGYELKHTGPLALDGGSLGVRFHHTIPQNREWDSDRWVICPYGAPGDHLWVREAFLGWYRSADRSFSHVAAYRASGYELEPGERWTPSIHMPRAASRIQLEVTGVRVERLQSISEADALAEGIDDGYLVRTKLPPPRRLAYSALWEDLNGPGSWAANPWVWVVEFKRNRP